MSYPSEESIDPLLSSAMAEANPTPETLAEKAQRALSSTTDLFLTEVYHRHLRSRDRRMHECAAKCCDNTKDSKIQVMGCVEQCSEDTISAKKVVRLVCSPPFFLLSYSVVTILLLQ